MKKSILDFTSRLPGPLATKILSDHGFRIQKIENLDHPDPFDSSPVDEHFKTWYFELNHRKEIIKLSFKNASLHDFHKLFDDSCGIITGGHQNFMDQLNLAYIFKNRAFVYLEIFSSESKIPQHDLNILALSGLLDLHLHNRKETIIPPPFLPVAGIGFAQNIALEFSIALAEANELQTIVHKKVYLENSLKKTYSFMLNSLQQNDYEYLHLGVFPCYCIYQFPTHYIVVAAIEEKFWKDFELKIGLGNCDRFDKSGKVHKEIHTKLSHFSKEELGAMFSDNKICINLISKN